MTTGTGQLRWQNWARTESAHPAQVAHPRDLEHLASIVRSRDGLRVRAVGAGHSFTGAAVTDGIQIRMDALNLLERVDPRPGGTALVTVGAGIRLHELNRVLAACGLAMRNLGDIDRQTLSGAISTGTHGTGSRLGGLATQVVGIRLVTAQGDVVDTSPQHQPELFEVARLGLGSVGVIAAITFEAVPAFHLRAVEEPLPLDEVLERLDGPDGLVDTHDHFEFYWFPHTRRALTKSNNRAPADAGPRLNPLRGWVDDELLSNGVFAATNRLAAAAPALTPRINRIASRALSARAYTAPSPDVFASPRRVRFREMEYAIPRDRVREVLAEIDSWIDSSAVNIPFPLEVRFAAPDDVWLSTAHGRSTAYVAAHQYLHLPYGRYFQAVERIMAQVDGRPHWGKLHWLGADRLSQLYPRFADACAVRAQADPEGAFSNEYVDRVLGPVAGAAHQS